MGLTGLANSFRVRKWFYSHPPGRCPGLEFANAFGVWDHQIKTAAPRSIAETGLCDFDPRTAHCAQLTAH